MAHEDATDDALDDAVVTLEDAATVEDALDDAVVEATPIILSGGSTSSSAPAVDTTTVVQPIVAATGILGFLPIVTFPWGINSQCAENSAQRAARMRAIRMANA